MPQTLDSPSNIVTLFFQALTMFLLHTLFWAATPFAGGYRFFSGSYTVAPARPAGLRACSLLPLVAVPLAAAAVRPAPASPGLAEGGVVEAAASAAVRTV